MQKTATSQRMAKFCIWTMQWQHLIAYHVKVFTWSASAIVMLLALAGKISFDAALYSIVICLFLISLLIWLFLRARRTSLLAIEDPVLRLQAHQSMLALIEKRPLSPADKKMLQGYFGERYCNLGHCRRSDFSQ